MPASTTRVVDHKNIAKQFSTFHDYVISFGLWSMETARSRIAACLSTQEMGRSDGREKEEEKGGSMNALSLGSQYPTHICVVPASSQSL